LARDHSLPDDSNHDAGHPTLAVIPAILAHSFKDPASSLDLGSKGLETEWRVVDDLCVDYSRDVGRTRER
jgi:hypothetical protein